MSEAQDKPRHVSGCITFVEPDIVTDATVCEFMDQLEALMDRYQVYRVEAKQTLMNEPMDEEHNDYVHH